MWRLTKARPIVDYTYRAYPLKSFHYILFCFVQKSRSCTLFRSNKQARSRFRCFKKRPNVHPGPHMNHNKNLTDTLTDTWMCFSSHWMISFENGWTHHKTSNIRFRWLKKDISGWCFLVYSSFGSTFSGRRSVSDECIFAVLLAKRTCFFVLHGWKKAGHPWESWKRVGRCPKIPRSKGPKKKQKQDESFIHILLPAPLKKENMLFLAGKYMVRGCRQTTSTPCYHFLFSFQSSKGARSWKPPRKDPPRSEHLHQMPSLASQFEVTPSPRRLYRINPKIAQSHRAVLKGHMVPSKNGPPHRARPHLTR